VQFDFMSRQQIEAVRQKAPSKYSPAWNEHWNEMAKKTVLRRVMKLVPLSTEKFVAAMEHDNTDFNIDGVLPSGGEAPAALQPGRTRIGRPTAPETVDVDPDTGEVINQPVDEEAAARIEKAREAAAEKPASETPAVAMPTSKPGKVRWDALTSAAHNKTKAEGPECKELVLAYLASKGHGPADLDNAEVRTALGDIDAIDWSEFQAGN